MGKIKKFFNRLTQGRFCMKCKSFIIFAVMVGAIFMNAGHANAQRFMEKLDRGLVAVKSGSGYFLSWRLFGTDPQDATFGFNVYKGATKLNTTPITNATNYQDNSAGTGTYTVKPVTGGIEGAVSNAAIVIDNGSYLNIPLTPPPGGSEPDGSIYTETANDASCGDLDGDGQYEIVLKWDPSNSHDNAQAGFTGPTYIDAYKLNGTRMWRINLGPNIRSGAHYTTFLVWDLDGDGKAEVACKTADGTIDGAGKVIGSATANYVEQSGSNVGRIMTGPEYWTIFNGQTGAALVTTNYKPPRYGTLTPTLAQLKAEWNDETGNRQDRMLGCVAYLDGERPSAVPCRGYYTRTCLWAVDWRGGKLTERWYFDTDSAGTGKDGKKLKSTSPASGDGYETMGCHSLREGDVDGDGFDEIVYGAMTVDHDGKGLYSTGLRHGDALHLAAMDPARGGLQVWQVHEETGAPPNGNGGIGATFRDAKDGTIIWSDAYTDDNGRGCCGPLIAGTTGWQFWSGAGGLWDVSHKNVGTKPKSTNFTMWWGGDLIRFTEDGTSITPFSGSGGFDAGPTMASCNGSKSTPCLTADLFGDWREELILRTSDNTALHIYTTVTPTTNRLYTLMHDPIYRMSVCSENAAYNQPPEPGIYIGPGMTLPQAKPNIKYYDGTMVSHDVPVHAYPQRPDNSFMKVFGDRSFSFPANLAGAVKSIAVYDLSGKLVQKAVVKKDNINLLKDFGLSNEIYMVRVKGELKSGI
jgi:rhamnogalacturonan endolyase